MFVAWEQDVEEEFGLKKNMVSEVCGGVNSVRGVQYVLQFVRILLTSTQIREKKILEKWKRN